jgi:hypothetical protein
MLADAMKFSGIPEGLVRRIAWTIDDVSWGFEFNETFDLEKTSLSGWDGQGTF